MFTERAGAFVSPISSIGILREIKSFKGVNVENRVVLPPNLVGELRGRLPQVKIFVETEAGRGIGASDIGYMEHGAEIMDRAHILQLSLILGVKETQDGDHALMAEPSIHMSYEHFAEDLKRLNTALETSRKSNVLFLALETMQDADGKFPTLSPMSEVAAEVVSNSVPQFFINPHGSGRLPTGIKGSGIKGMKAVVLGGGVVGRTAAWRLSGMGLNVSLLETNSKKREYLKTEFENRENVHIHDSTIETLPYAFRGARVLVSGLYLKGTNPPKIVTDDLLSLMAKPAIVFFVDIDQGGPYKNENKKVPPTSIYDMERRSLPQLIPGVSVWAPPNLPSLVSVDSSEAIGKAVMPYVEKIAMMGLIPAALRDQTILSGINIFNGEICEPNLARTFGLRHVPFEDLIREPVHA